MPRTRSLFKRGRLLAVLAAGRDAGAARFPSGGGKNSFQICSLLWLMNEIIAQCTVKKLDLGQFYSLPALSRAATTRVSWRESSSVKPRFCWVPRRRRPAYVHCFLSFTNTLSVFFQTTKCGLYWIWGLIAKLQPHLMSAGWRQGRKRQWQGQG